MEIITISGRVSSDAEKLTDRKGSEYIRFRVGCWRKDEKGKDIITSYNCYSYFTGYSRLKRGDTVFLSGMFVQKINTGTDGKEHVNNQVFVEHLSKAGHIKNDTGDNE